MPLTPTQRHAISEHYRDILCRLGDVPYYLPDDCEILRELAGRVGEEMATAEQRIDRFAEYDRCVFSEIGFALLQLARPAIPERFAEIVGRIDALIAQINEEK